MILYIYNLSFSFFFPKFPKSLLAKQDLDILKMSKIDFGPGGLAKKVKKVIVTIMLSFPFLDEKCCDANFFHFYFQNFCI
jgi:hypothetical protein